MKVRCVKATHEKFKLFGPNETVQIEGLTEGKIYDAQPILYISGGGNMSVTTYLQFFLFNDLGQWDSYDADRFVPADYEASDLELLERSMK